MPLEKRILADGCEWTIREIFEPLSVGQNVIHCIYLHRHGSGWWRIYRNGGREYTPYAERLPPEALQRALGVWVKAGAEYGDCTLMEFLTEMGVAKEV